MARREFDYVIVGSGPAGAALAARLTEDVDVRVLLLEAGDADRSLKIRIPAAFPALFGSSYDWGYRTAPQQTMGGRRLFFPQGRTLGGSSSINAQMYIRGHRLDYDAWQVPGWSYDDLLPCFKRAERNQRGAGAFHGDGGPWHVSDLRDPNPLARAFVSGAAAIGVPANRDFNGADLDGVGFVQVMQRRGRRWSAADAYLRGSRRRNLTVLSGAAATRIVVTRGTATGVEFRHRGASHAVRAVREVLVCAGAIGSPRLLLLSGIGPASELRRHGIAVICDSPEVGRNLQDHLLTPLRYEALRPVSLYGAQSLRELFRYVWSRRGLLTSNAGEAAAFLRSDPAEPAPDLELILATVLFPGDDLAPPSRHGFTIGVVPLQPRSRGSVSLGGPDPLAPPLIQPGYLADGADVRSAVDGIRRARALVAASAFDGLRGQELDPGPSVVTERDLEACVRSLSQSISHAVGTCRMGTDASAVVGPDLRVRGVDHLRVADASVIPRITRGHTAAPAMAIGERAADIIRKRQDCESASPIRRAS